MLIFPPPLKAHPGVDWFFICHNLKNIATVYKAAILPRNIEIMAFIATIIKCLKTIQTWLVFVVLFFSGDRFHSRPFLHVHIGTLIGTLKLSAEVKKKKTKQYPFPVYHSSLEYTHLSNIFLTFLTISLSQSLVLGIFHLESTSFAEARRQFINLKPLSATALAFTWHKPLI